MFDWLTDGIVSYIIDVFTSLVANIESLSILAQRLLLSLTLKFGKQLPHLIRQRFYP